MWSKISDNKLYVVSSRRDSDFFTGVEGIYVNIDSCVESVIEILREGYAAREEEEEIDFPEDKLRKEITNKFDHYTSYWNDFLDITFDVTPSCVWKYEKWD